MKSAPSFAGGAQHNPIPNAVKNKIDLSFDICHGYIIGNVCESFIQNLDNLSLGFVWFALSWSKFVNSGLAVSLSHFFLYRFSFRRQFKKFFSFVDSFICFEKFFGFCFGNIEFFHQFFNLRHSIHLLYANSIT